MPAVTPSYVRHINSVYIQVRSLLVTILVGIILVLVFYLYLQETIVIDKHVYKHRNGTSMFTPFTSVYMKNYESDKYLDNFPSFDANNCPSCLFTSTNYRPNSTPRDLLITTMFDHVYNIIPSIRSIRTSKCQAQYFVLTDLKTRKKLTDDTIKILKSCGGYVVRYLRLKKLDRSIIFTLRQILVYNFIGKRAHLLDRVISFDLYDTIFQGDPFTPEIKQDGLYFILENTTYHFIYNEEHYDVKFSRYTKEDYDKFNIINGATIMGGVVNVMEYMHFYLSNNPLTLDNHPDDQWYLNKYVYNGDLAKAGIKFKLFDMKSRYVSICRTYNYPTKWDIGNYKPADSKVNPLLIHQFDDVPKLLHNVYEKCPKGNLIVNQYIRRIDDPDYYSQ